MLNLVAYRKLSNPDYMPEVALRMFLQMLCDFELSHFRAISLHRLVELYGFNEKRQARRLNLLLDLGLLETGSMVVDEVEGKIVEIPAPFEFFRADEDSQFGPVLDNHGWIRSLHVPELPGELIPVQNP